MNLVPNQPSTAPLVTRQTTFPRTTDLPVQSPKYWVKEKDRYLRQLLIEDIQDLTDRELVVYFTNQGMIDFRDADDISEVLDDCSTRKVDLLLQTPGGIVDACEKVISVLKLRVGTYRVIIPSWAKSAGTIIALASSEIVMGVNSELGPIDPQFNSIPAEFIKDDPSQQYPVRQIAESAIKRTRKLASQVLSKGMLKGQDQMRIDSLVDQLSSAQSYSSHGAVINAEEVKEFGLNVRFLHSQDELWKKLWLLYCMYDFDCQRNGYAKLFEGARVSIARPLPPNGQG
ncbi:MAG: hypothetical protein HC881_01455 [Leptolyngbyaceae cyanobacterium SL_7_1]|nr:hypothetical protein [Leptolyngbyaceae cyanobacterium SL_7_1]